MAGGIAKLELFNNLRKDRPADEEIAAGESHPAGYVHLPKVDAEYCKQLCSEQLVTTRNRRGYTVREWRKLRERNEALDCYVYARAAAAVVGLDRFKERHWRKLGNSLGGGPAPKSKQQRPSKPKARPSLVRPGHHQDAGPGRIRRRRAGPQEAGTAEGRTGTERKWIEACFAAFVPDAYDGTGEEGLAAAERGVVELSQWTAGLRDAMRAADGHNSLMSSLRHAARTEDGTLLFVHAGIAVSRPLAEQGDAFWWGDQDFGDMAAPYMDYRRVVRGFAADHPGFGGPLLAACFGADGEPVDNLQT